MKAIQLQLSAALLICLTLVIQACSNVNPFAVAESPTQQVYALESTYNIVLEQAVKAVNLESTSQNTKDRIVAAERRATPVIESLSQAFKEYTLVRIQLAQGSTSEEKMAIAAEDLEAWVLKAEAAIANLSAAVD